MTTLTKRELDELDSELDSYVPSAELVPLPLDRVLSHLLFLAEIGEKTKTIAKLDHAALDISVGWAHKFCKKVDPRKLNVEFDHKLFNMVIEIYNQARHYNAVSGIMSLLYKGKLVGNRIDSVIETQLGASYDLGMAVAESELFGPNDPTRPLPDNSEISSHYAKCVRRKNGYRKLKYTLPDELFIGVQRLVHEISENNWQLDPNLDVGGYSLADYRRLMEALATFGQIHHYCNAAPPLQEIPLKDIWFNSLLKMTSKTKWIRLLKRLSGLDSETIVRIFSDIVYDPRTGAQKNPKPDLISTPLFPISADLFVLSNRLAFEGNWERNFWKRLSITKPTIHSALSTSKELRQIEDLVALLASIPNTAHLKLLPRLRVQKKTDLDLLVLDIPSRFGLALQLKWPYGPAYYRDMQKVWEELDKGVENLILALPWLYNVPQALVQKSQLSEEYLREFRFKALLLSRNSVGFGWMNYRSDIPICSERFLKWALVEKKVSLEQFWELAARYAYKPKENVHYSSKVIRPKFGSIEFSAPTAFNVLARFDEAIDIDWFA